MFLKSQVGHSPCWRAWAGEEVGSSGVGFGGRSGILVRDGVPVLVLVGLCLPGLGDRPFSLYLGWGRCVVRGVGSSRVGVGEGSGVLVLRSLWGALGFERFPA